MSVENIILALIALVVLGIVVMLLYLLDRVDTLEKRQTPDATADCSARCLPAVLAPWVGANSGTPPAALVTKQPCPRCLAALRENLRPVLVKHVQEVFQPRGQRRPQITATSRPSPTAPLPPCGHASKATVPRHKSQPCTAAAKNTPPPPRHATHACGQNLEQIGGAIQGKSQIALAEPFASLVLSPTELEATKPLPPPTAARRAAQRSQLNPAPRTNAATSGLKLGRACRFLRHRQLR